MLIEQTTTYAYKLKYLDNPTFDKVRGFAKKFIDDLPKELVDGLYSQLERGVVQIDSEPQMLVYLYSFGKMHQAKLHKAFENIPPVFFEQPVINIIDYGSGQAIETMCYVDNFAEFFYIINKVDNYRKTFYEFEPDPNETWTAHIRCFSVGKFISF